MARPLTRLEVVADGAKWTIREHGIGRLNSFKTRPEAATAARAIALQHTPCDLIIRNADGTSESEQSFR